MPTLLRTPCAALLAAACLVLAACGGGGGGGTGGSGTDGSDVASGTPRFGPSSLYAGMCTLEEQRSFVRSYLDEVYLWYKEVPEVDETRFNNIPSYFDALRVRTPDVNGLAKDRFSAVVPTSFLADEAAKGPTDSVPAAKILATPTGRRVGYIQFTDHEIGAQDALITAFRQVRQAGVQDLVLDLRFNTGGYLYISLAAASMVAGPAAEGQVFEALRYNDKRQALSNASILRFSGQVQFAEPQNPRGTPLPQLDLRRLYVLSSGLTCSASESIVNGLRGIDIEVVLVGDTTCGKPYGFTRRDNCGYTYFPIEFNGVNARGNGDYTSGFQPACRVADNTAVLAGSASDPLLQAAMGHIDAGTCPPAPATSAVAKSAPEDPRAPRAARTSWDARVPPAR